MRYDKAMSDKSEKTTSEQTHNEVAKAVVTPKRKYFFPDYGKTVEVDETGDTAKELAEATKLVEKEVKDEKGTE